MIKLKDISTGDYVYCTGDSSFCDSSYEVVIHTTRKYDENNGESYKVIYLSENRQFDSRDGCAMTPPTMYYITPTDQKKAFAAVQKTRQESDVNKAEIKNWLTKKEAILAKLTPEERKILGV